MLSCLAEESSVSVKFRYGLSQKDSTMSPRIYSYSFLFSMLFPHSFILMLIPQGHKMIVGSNQGFIPSHSGHRKGRQLLQKKPWAVVFMDGPRSGVHPTSIRWPWFRLDAIALDRNKVKLTQKPMVLYGEMSGPPKDNCDILPRRNGITCWAAKQHLIYFNPSVSGRSLSDCNVLKWDMILIMFVWGASYLLIKVSLYYNIISWNTKASRRNQIHLIFWIMIKNITHFQEKFPRCILFLWGWMFPQMQSLIMHIPLRSWRARFWNVHCM